MGHSRIKKEVLYGFHSVFEALKARRRSIYKIFILENKKSDRNTSIYTLAKLIGVECKFVNNSKIKLISGVENHQGFAALVSSVTMFNIETMLKKNSFFLSSFLLVALDGILDTHNFGAIIRTAYCFGASGVMIAKDRACSPTPAVSKISSGALEHIPIFCVTNIPNAIKILKKNGVWIAGLDAKKSNINLLNADMSGRLAIVIGNEKKGLRPLVSRYCDFLVSVPMEGQLDSLNASVTAAVVLYEIYRQRINL